MAKLQAAHQFIDAAEKKLRELIAQAAADGDYGVISQLVEAAEGLRRTTRLLEGAEAARAEMAESEQQSGAPTAAAAPATANEADQIKRLTKEYPRFERQEDRLIKVGWSKKDRAEYEHRTDKEIASAVSLYLAETPKDKTFRMDDLLPIEIDEKEVPLYQAYLVLAWLRDRGLIGKQGKDGYQWLVGDFDEPAFEAAWGSTPRRN